MVELIEQDYLKNKEIFENLKIKLKEKLGDNIIIEHVGSTAIPDMCGKNIIDILVGASDQVEFEKLKGMIERLKYYPSQNSKTEIYQFFASKIEETGSGDVHIHLVLKGTDRYNDFVVLRDYLLCEPNEAKMYADFKRELIKKMLLIEKIIGLKKANMSQNW